MAARTQNYICQNCGAAYVRWSGRCDACGEWNTLVAEGGSTSMRASRKGRLFVIEPLKGEHTRRQGSLPASLNSTA
jgi:DNA repair protein RadA/Sms